MTHDNNDLLRMVQQGFDNIRRGEDPYQSIRPTGLAKSLDADAPEDDDSAYAQRRRRLNDARAHSHSSGYDESQSPDEIETDEAPAYGDVPEIVTEGPEWTPGMWRLQRAAVLDTLVHTAAAKARQDAHGETYRVEPRSPRSKPSR